MQPAENAIPAMYLSLVNKISVKYFVLITMPAEVFAPSFILDGSRQENEATLTQSTQHSIFPQKNCVHHYAPSDRHFFEDAHPGQYVG